MPDENDPSKEIMRWVSMLSDAAGATFGAVVGTVSAGLPGAVAGVVSGVFAAIVSKQRLKSV